MQEFNVSLKDKPGELASVASAEVISHYGARPLVKLSSLI